MLREGEDESGGCYERVRMMTKGEGCVVRVRARVRVADDVKVRVEDVCCVCVCV